MLKTQFYCNIPSSPSNYLDAEFDSNFKFKCGYSYNSILETMNNLKCCIWTI